MSDQWAIFAAVMTLGVGVIIGLLIIVVLILANIERQLAAADTDSKSKAVRP